MILLNLQNEKKKKLSTSNILVIDTETTGLPITIGFDKYYSPKELKYYDNSRLIELAYIIYSENGHIIKEVCHLIKPNNFEINNSQFHGITNEMVSQNGIDINKAIDELNKDLDTVNKIVAHNINFDIHILLSECYRMNKDKIANKIEITKKDCTMKMGKFFMKQYRSPKLVDLYKFIFKKNVIQEHRALSDVVLCAECYFQMQ